VCSVRMRLLITSILAGLLIAAILAVTLNTGTEPQRLMDALLILIGYLARDATTRVAGSKHAEGGAAHHPF
jgi:ABC-type uncharacterized transport system permease subunit